MSKPDDAYQHFQRYVWNRLPMRKYLCGHTRVFDIVAVVVQEWPTKEIDRSKSGDTSEVVALEELAKSVKRHLALAYGHQNWEVWHLSLVPMAWQCILTTLEWYRGSKKNAASLNRWRSKWRKSGK